MVGVRLLRLGLVVASALVAVAPGLPSASAAENPSGIPGAVGDTGLRTSVSMSTDHSCALTDDGHLRCWGSDGPPGAPDGRVSEPNAATDETFTSVAAGPAQTCAVTTDGVIDCWGDDSNHQVSGPTNMADLGPIVRGAFFDGIVSSGGTTLRSNTASFVTSDVGLIAFVPSGPDAGEYRVATVVDSTTVTVAQAFPFAAGGGSPLAFYLQRRSTAPFTQVSVGGAHTCAIRVDGELACWGNDGFGQVSGPNAFGGRFRSVAAGNNATCAVGEDLVVVCWGDPSEYRIQFGPTVILDLDGSVARSIASGPGTTCIVHYTGKLFCAGTDVGGSVFLPTFGDTDKYSSVSTALSHTCAVRIDGRLVCFGVDVDGSVTGPNTDPGTFAAVATNITGTCALTLAGAVMCWGQDQSGELAGPQTPPFPAERLRGPFQDGVVLAGQSTLSAKDGGFTSDDLGRLLVIRSGPNAGIYGIWTVMSATKVVVSHPFSTTSTVEQFAIHAVSSSVFATTSVAAGAYHTCDIAPGGHLDCFGKDTGGDVTGPDADPGTFVSVAAGRSQTCAISTAAALHCWGTDSGGSVTGPNASTDTFRQVSAGRFHTCALTVGAALDCWGTDTGGDVSGPTGLENYLSVSAGQHHTCALDTEADVHCWGADVYGEVAGPNADIGHRYVSVAAGWYHTCALRTDGRLQCWGIDAPEVNKPNASTDLYVSVATGVHDTCALRFDGQIDCWGTGGGAEITDPDGRSSYTSVATGWYHTCAVRTDGMVECFGRDGSPQLGTSPLITSPPPPDGQLTVPYSFAMTVTGSPAPTFALASGALPPGLGLGSDGLISGTPTAKGTFAGTIAASNAAGTSSQAFSITIGPAPLTTFTIHIRRRPSKIPVFGLIDPVPDGSVVRVSLQHEVQRGWAEIGIRSVSVTASGYSTSFPRPGTGNYRVVATFAGSPDVAAGTVARVFALT